MNDFSYFEVQCLCGEPVKTRTATATCEKCGRTIQLESWQVKKTMTAAGLVIDTPPKREVRTVDPSASPAGQARQQPQKGE